MIVEDEAIIALDLQRTLEGLGHAVTARLSSAAEAVEKASADTPDLVLMDVLLKGDMDGIEAAEIIHSRLAVPVIFLSAEANQDQLDRARLPASCCYIRKPFSTMELKAAIESALEDSLRGGRESPGSPQRGEASQRQRS